MMRSGFGQLCNNEQFCYCSGNICLTGGNCTSGNVFLGGKPICDGFWGIEDANVVCKSIGFLGARSYTENSRHVINQGN